MSYTRSYAVKAPHSSRQKRKDSEQIHNVISLRINDDEKKELAKLTKATSKSISEIMREAIDLWRSRQRRLSMDCAA